MREDENTAAVLRFLTCLPRQGIRLHLGWGSFRNLDIMAARRSDYAVLCDINLHQFRAWRAVRHAIVGAATADQFLTGVVRRLPRRPPLRQFVPDPHCWLAAELDRAESWLYRGAPERYAHIRRCFMERRIRRACLNLIAPPESFRSLATKLAAHARICPWHLDTVYVSNIPFMLQRPSGFFDEPLPAGVQHPRDVSGRILANLSALPWHAAWVITAEHAASHSRPDDLQWRTDLYRADAYPPSAANENWARLDPTQQAGILAAVGLTAPVKPDVSSDEALSRHYPTLVKAPFDLAHWQQVAAEKYPHGLPKPHSVDPTQWLFDGHPKGALTPLPSPGGRGEGLQVAVARLLGYRWPRQTGSSFPDCPALGPDGLEEHADGDGIVALNPVKGEQAAEARLRALLADAFGGEWSAARLGALLAQVGSPGKSLDDWLRDGFFEQHCALFHQRPFVWHIWDGRRDGFHALVNYHCLAAPNVEGRRTLEKLLYSYLGDCIDRQRANQKAGVEGADARIAAAEHLKSELTNILEGDVPYYLFVRWKPLAEQPIGWEPDINDGVRINIRRFMTARLAPSPRPSPGRRGSKRCILRVAPKIKWDKDRGKEPQRAREHFPWFWGCDERAIDFAGGKTFDGNRWNDLHYTRAFKQAA